MKLKRIAAIFVLLCLLVGLLPPMQTHATTTAVPDTGVVANPTTVTESKPIQLAAPEQTYMTLEEAGAYVAQKMVARESGFPLYFKIERADVMAEGHAWEVLMNEVHRHTGDGRFGDNLRWAQHESGYGGGKDYNDGTTYYANWNSVTFTYYSTAEQEKILDQKVDQIISSLELNGKSDYEKIKAVYEYVCKNVEYAIEAIEGTYAPYSPEWNRCYSAYGALCHGEATCQGFSTAIYRLMLEAGIDCRLIAGEDHGWNIVALDGKYYLLDATWDSDHWRVTGEFDWFLRGSANFRDLGHREWGYYVNDEYGVYNISKLDYNTPTYGPADVIASGSCGSKGNNVTWTLTGDGTMTLTGTGNTDDYMYLYAPWQGYNGYIKKLVIGEGITGIGNFMFYNCTALTEIQFSTTLTTIGESTFACCDSLTELTLPETIKELGVEAFSRCLNLKKVTLPNSVTQLPDGLLFNCVRLEEVKLGNSLTEIGANVFSGCTELKGMTFPSSLTRIGEAAFSSAFDIDSKVKLVIPENVTYVGEKCFAWSYLNEVDWQAATPTMEFWTFYNCRQLEKVTLSNYITSIDDECFQWNTLLKEVKLSANLQSVGADVFGQCKNLKTVALPTSLTVIGVRMFSGSGLESLMLHEGITTIGQGAFQECKLKEITFPSSLAVVGERIFIDCKPLKKITFLGDFPRIDGNPSNVLHSAGCIAYYPYGNPTWTEEALQSLAPETADFTWRTKHPEGAEHIPIIDYQMQYDVNGHWWACRGCDGKVDYEDHTLSGPIQDGDKWYNACTTCWANIYFEHVHDWTPANCQQPKTCYTCGATEGDVVDHNWRKATCTEPKTCSYCWTTEGDALGHDYKTVVMAPTCTEEGYTTYTCANCGDSYPSDYVGAFGHQNVQDATCTTEQMCLDCGTALSPSLGHVWDNNVCLVCGEQFTLAPTNQSMVIGNTLQVFVWVQQSRITGDGYYAKVTQKVEGGIREETIYQSDWVKDDAAGVWKIPYAGVAAKEMTDEITVIVYDANGKQITKERTMTVESYALSQYSKTNSAELKSVLVDMLNYGAAAQKYFGYKVDTLANANLTKEHQKYATGDVEAEDNRKIGGNITASLSLENSLEMNFMVRGDTYANADYAIVTMINHYGEEVEIRYDTLEEKLYSGTTVGCVTVDVLAVADAKTLVHCKIYDVKGNELTYCDYSIETYVARMSNAALADINDAIMKFGVSAYNYFH